MKADESDMIQLLQDSFKKFATDHIRADQIDRDAAIPADVINGLKEMGLFGLIIPEAYGGLGLSTSAYVRLLECIAAIDSSVALTIGAHQSIGLKGLMLFGTEEQKQKFLPRLATGEMIAAFCLTEAGAGSDAAGIKSHVVPDKSGETYLLNGTKLWITNGGIADFLTVFAKEPIRGKDDKVDEKISAFIVTRDMPGVHSGREESKLGIRGSSTTEIYFENVRIPRSNLLGERGRGFKLAMHVLNSGRLGLAGASLGALKMLLKISLDHIRQRKQFGKCLSEFELIQKKITQLTLDIFATESMVYLTTGLIDRGDVDYSLESAMCKVRATDIAWAGVNECLQMAGGIGYMSEYPYQRLLRDARINLIFEGTNEILRLFISLAGVQERGEYLRKIGKALRGPIKGFGLLTGYAGKWVKGRVTREKIREVHPALADAKLNFETWAQHLHFSAERALIHHGKNIIFREMIQERLSNAAMDLFAMIACISRVDALIRKKGASDCRSEIDLTNTFCEQAWRRVRRELLMADSNNDHAIKDIANFIVESQKYPF